MQQVITEEYRKLNESLHKKNCGYGIRGKRHLDKVLELCKKYNLESVLDYGCGKGTLGEEFCKLGLSVRFYSYDPCVKDFSEPPIDMFELVVCTDVLEHIEPNLLDNVLRHINSCCKYLVYFVISTKTDKVKRLDDGSNPHKIVEDSMWWKKKLYEHFVRVDIINEDKNDSTFIAYA